VGKFWKGTIGSRDIERDDFARFDEPGFGKIACDFRVKSLADGRTLLSYECRTATTSAGARRKFARYWWLSPVRRTHHARDRRNRCARCGDRGSAFVSRLRAA
jgi:hypothetical protein